MGVKPLNDSIGIYVKNLACVRVKGGERDCFVVDSGVKQGCIAFTWLFNMYLDAAMKEVKMEMGRMGENGNCSTSYMQMT